MTRANLAYNPSFRGGTDGYTALNGAALAVKTGFAFYGDEALQVTKPARNGAGVQSTNIAVTEGLKYAYSAYVAVPPIAPKQEAAGLVLTVTWLTAAGVVVSTDSTPIVTVEAGGGWDRLTGVSVAPQGASWAGMSISQLVAGSARQTFYVDALLFEQAAYVGGYLDNISRAVHSHLQDTGLSAYPLPTIGGLQLLADITLGDLVLNTIDENNVTWVCTDIDGWWGHSEPDMVDIDRGVADGSYDVSGRTKARTFTLEGSFLLDDPNKLTATRDRLVSATNLIRKGAWLRTNEEPTRAAFVRLNGKPKIETVNARGRTNFSIGLKAADPIRYEWNDQDPDGLNTLEISVPDTRINYVTNPSMETSDAPVTYGTNYITNPSAEGANLSLTGGTNGVVSIVSDSVTGTGTKSYRVASNAAVPYYATNVNAVPASAGQRWWGTARTRLDASVIGSRNIGAYLQFFDASANPIGTGQDGSSVVSYNPSGVFHTWTGTPDLSQSIEVSSSATRRNLIANPAFRNSMDSWFIYDPQNYPSVTPGTDALEAPVSTYIRATWGADNTIVGGGYYTSITGGGFNPADPISASMWLRTSQSQAIYVSFEWLDSSNNILDVYRGEEILTQAKSWTPVQISTQIPNNPAISKINMTIYTSDSGHAWTTGETFDVTAVLVEVANSPGLYFDGASANTGTGNTQEVKSLAVSAVAPNNTASVKLFFYGDSATGQGTDVFYADNVLLTQDASTVAPSYFDGNSTPTSTDDKNAYVWAGAVNNSYSYKQYTAVDGVVSSNAVAFRSDLWSINGTYSLQFYPAPTANRNAYVEFLPMVQGTLTQGNTYTLSLTAYRDVNGTMASPLVYRAFIGDTQVYEVAATIPAAAGTYPVSITFTVPASADGQALRLYNYEPASGNSLWVDDLILTDGSDIVEYFDGDSFDTDSSIYNWTGIAHQSTSRKSPGQTMVGIVPNIGTANVTGVFTLAGPLGAGSYIYNASTAETITTTNELRGVGGAAPITNTQLTDKIATITTSVPHNLEVGDKVVISGAGKPYDSETGYRLVTAVSNIYPYTFNFDCDWVDMDAVSASGQVNLAYPDVLTLDTYNQSVVFNDKVEGNRYRVATLVDWMQLAPGDNVISFVDVAEQRQVISKSSAGLTASLTTADAHFLQPGDTMFVNLPVTASLAKKSLTSNVVTITTAADHGFSLGDRVNVVSTEVSNVISKARTSNVVTLGTDVLGSFAVNDSVAVALPISASITAKSLTSNVATLTTSKTHGFSVGDTVSATFPSVATVAGKNTVAGQTTITTTNAHGFAVGDTMSVSLPTSTTVVRKFVQGTNVVLTTQAIHGYSIGDIIVITLPTSASLNGQRSMSGTSTYLATLGTSAAHGFVVGDVVNVTTNLVNNWQVSARSATATSMTITTDSAHEIMLGERIRVQGVGAQYDGSWTVTAISGNSITYGNFGFGGQYTAETSTASSGQVTNLTLKEGYDGTHVIEAVPSPTSFSFIYNDQQTSSSHNSSTIGSVTNTTNAPLVGTFRLSGTPSTTQISYQTTDTVSQGGTTNQATPV